MSEVKRIDVERIDIKEFRETGFLQEANRQFFHPHGLALEITQIKDDSYESWLEDVAPDELINSDPTGYSFFNHFWMMGRVWDERDDHEGVWFDWPSWKKEWFEEDGKR